MVLTFGKVAHPPFQDRLIPDFQTHAWDNLGQRKALGVCQHSMIGSLWGTDSFFRSGAAGLTDYGIGGATDGVQWDGVIFRWNDPLGKAHTVTYDGIVNGKVSPNRWGWASGGTDGLEGDGTAWVNKYGPNSVNGYLVSIERSDGGNINTPMSNKQFESICQLTAYWADQAEIPHDQFPYSPSEDLIVHFLHKEFATKDCPFPVVYNDINRIQDRVRAILKAAQMGTDVPEPEPEPIPDPGDDTLLPLPDGMSWELVDRLYGTWVSEWGEIFDWNKERAACQVWYNRAVRSIPQGQSWDKGVWPEIMHVIRRGVQADGSRDYIVRWTEGPPYVNHRANG